MVNQAKYHLLISPGESQGQARSILEQSGRTERAGRQIVPDLGVRARTLCLN